MAITSNWQTSKTSRFPFSSETDEMEQKHKEEEIQKQHDNETKENSLGFEIPSHLPKKQREMFIRIQQQQMREKEKREREKAASKQTEEKASAKGIT